jgi:hypothetical protein
MEVIIQALKAIRLTIPILVSEIRSCGFGQHAADCAATLRECLLAVDAQAKVFHALGVNADYSVEALYPEAMAVLKKYGY